MHIVYDQNLFPKHIHNIKDIMYFISILFYKFLLKITNMVFLWKHVLISYWSYKIFYGIYCDQSQMQSNKYHKIWYKINNLLFTFFYVSISEVFIWQLDLISPKIRHKLFYGIYFQILIETDLYDMARN